MPFIIRAGTLIKIQKRGSGHEVRHVTKRVLILEYMKDGNNGYFSAYVDGWDVRARKSDVIIVPGQQRGPV